MDHLTDTQEYVCRALAALGGTADAAEAAAWIGTHRGRTVAPPDLRREARDLIDRGFVRVVGERDAGDARPANVYTLTGAGAALVAGLLDDRPTPNELAQDRPEP